MVTNRSQFYVCVRELTDNVQVDEGFSLSVFVLDDDLVAALVALLGVLQAVLCAVSRGVDVVFGKTRAVVLPVSLRFRVCTVGDCHGDGLSGICDITLVCGLYLRHSCKRREGVDVVMETRTPGCMFSISLVFCFICLLK